MIRQTLGLAIAGLLLVGMAFPVAGTPLEQARKSAETMSEQGRGLAVTQDAGRAPFRLEPNNGYPGTEATLRIAQDYEVFEHGVHRTKTIAHVVIDWGDGSGTDRIGGGQTVSHVYGQRDPDGAISPGRDTDYIGRITINTVDGDSFTEYFRFVLWVDGDRGRRGGRLLPHEQAEPVRDGDGFFWQEKLPSGFHDPQAW